MKEFLRGTVTAKDWTAVGIICTLTALIVAVFLLFIHANQKTELEKIAEDNTQVVKDLDNAHRVEAKIDDLRAEMAKIQTIVAEFEKRLPPDREIPRLLEQFEAIAKDVGLEVDLKSTAREEIANTERIPYEIKAKGDFHQLAEFINRLERYERYLKISNLKVAKEEKGISEASFTLSTYRFIERSKPEAAGEGKTQ